MPRLSLLASAAVLVLPAAAIAADLPSRSAAPAFVAAAPALNWSGFYVGGHIGAIRTRVKLEVIGNSEGYSGSNDWNNASAGVHAGYDHQIGQIVVGVEADVNLRFSDASPVSFGGRVAEDGYRSSAKWDASLRARLGYLVTPDALLYLTGGVVAANFKFTNPGCDACADWGNANLNGGNRVGWTLGAGVQYALSQTLSVRVEYRHNDFGTKTITYDAGKSSSSRITDDRITVGLSYKFGQPAGPVVARY
jgi:outer membrane immunogenic protein